MTNDINIVGKSVYSQKWNEDINDDLTNKKSAVKTWQAAFLIELVECFRCWSWRKREIRVYVKTNTRRRCSTILTLWNSTRKIIPCTVTGPWYFWSYNNTILQWKMLLWQLNLNRIGQRCERKYYNFIQFLFTILYFLLSLLSFVLNFVLKVVFIGCWIR